MLNQAVIVGRLLEKSIVEEKNDRKVSIIKLVCQRPFKNEEGAYDNDIIPVIIYDGIATNTYEYVNANDLIGAKCRIEQDGDKIVLVGEKVTFLSSKKEQE